ncbi:MAG: hypothetical protein P1V97_33730 [Planctomycetota bacterium]|nr:hypothetical protein [Planctomycetota bacterium]
MKRPTGLKIFQNLISEGEVQEILAQEETANSKGQLFRLFGEFGGKKAKKPSPWMQEWGARLKREGLFSELPNQYRLCDWIGEHSSQFKWHIDNSRHGEKILVLCLSEKRAIGFRKRGKRESFELELCAGDAYMIAGAARWSWEHCILPVGEGKSGGKSFIMSYKRV